MADYLNRNPYIGRRVTIIDSGSEKQYECVGKTPNGFAILTFDDVMVAQLPFERLFLLPMIDTTPKGFQRTGEFLTTPDEATEWFAFTMLQAGMLFNNVPTPHCTLCENTGRRRTNGDVCDHTGIVDQSRDEIVRIMTARGLPADGPDVFGALAYYDATMAWHEADKAKWND